MKRVRYLAGLMLSAALVLTTALGQAGATAGTPGAESGKLAAEKMVVKRVASARDHEAAFRSLTAAQKALFLESLKHLTATVISSRGGPVAGTRALATGTGCWWHYQFDSWSDLGEHEGDTWMQLNWCAQNSKITSYYISNTGGRGALFNYDGKVSHGYLNVGWEVRAYQEFKFNFFMQNFYPCMQIRGGATGLYSTRRSCNLS
jgi:hypothetical protein